MKFLRFMALLEGSSLLILLFIAVPLKAYFGIPEAVKMIGPIHGMLFLAFNAMLMVNSNNGNLTGKQALLGSVASFIPFGTFVFKARILNIYS